MLIMSAIIALTSFLQPPPSAVMTPPTAQTTPDMVAESNDTYRLRTKLRSSGLASGNADFREWQTSDGRIARMFKVEIEDARPNKKYIIRLNGVYYKTITTDSNGFAERKFRTLTDDPDGPNPVPFMAPGTKVRVGPVTGWLRRK